jgi:4-amino-4-deoxy-L-arabinose transferase-like glycosyltransferase
MTRTTALAVLSALTLIVAALSIGSVRMDSATADEPAHIVAGYLKLVHGQLDFFREQPPLMNSLSALPLVMAGYRFPPAEVAPDNHWTVGRQFLYRSGFDAHRMLLLARLPTIALFLILGWTVYAAATRFSGSRAWGIVAFILVMFCPTMMAHGRLATVDLAVTLFCFAAGLMFLRLIDAPTVLNAVAFGSLCALGLLSKTSAVILAPWAALVLVLAFVMRKVARPRALFVGIVVSIVAALLTFEVMTLALAGDDYVAKKVPDGSLSGRLMLPFSELKANVDIIRAWYSHRFKLQYFMGRFSSRGWPEYYPVALLLKTTLPALLIVAIALFMAVRRRYLSFAGAAFALFVVLFLVVAAMGELALGVRYVLPVIPFAYASAAILLAGTNVAWTAEAAADSSVWRRLSSRPSIAVAALLLMWHVGENLFAYPSYIAYFNESIGSHRNADLYLIDSNLDWGQDLRRLDAWCHKNGVETIAVHTAGGGDLEADMTVRTIAVWNPGVPPLPKGYFAVGRHPYRASFSGLVSSVDYAHYLVSLKARYVTTIGGSMDVYQIP